MDQSGKNQIVSKQLESKLHQVIKTNDALEFERLYSCNGLGPDYCFTLVPPLIALIQHLVQENFVSAVELVLATTIPCPRGNVHLRKAFDYAFKNDLSDVLRRFIRATLARTINILSLEQVFECAMEKGFCELTIDISKDQMFDLNIPNFEGTGIHRRRSPLHWAVFCEQPLLLEDFLDRGAIIDIEDRNGFTPLALACQLESYDCCLVLLNHGADPNHDSELFPGRNRSPLAACVSPWYHDFTRTGERNCLVVRLLLLMKRAGLRLGQIYEVQKETGVEMSDHRPLQIVGVVASPLTLEDECCRVIRRHLASVSQGLSIAKHLENLPLPEIIIKHFLHLK